MSAIKLLHCHTVHENNGDIELGREYRVVRETQDSYTIIVPYLNEDGEITTYSATFSKENDRFGLSYKSWFTLAEIQL